MYLAECLYTTIKQKTNKRKKKIETHENYRYVSSSPAMNSSGDLSKCGVAKLRNIGRLMRESLTGFKRARIANIICWLSSAGDSMHR
jgi:hypothetical protein